jgi:hypothetical protein
VQVCLWGDFTREDGTATAQSGPFCFGQPSETLPFKNLGIGTHTIHAAIAYMSPEDKAGAPTIVSKQSSVNFDVKVLADFVPTYEWQHIEEGQSVPPGLEVRLPLNGYVLLLTAFTTQQTLL